MEPNEFIKFAEDYCYKEVAKNANLILGKNKTASLSTGLFLKLPINVTIEQTDEPLPKLYKELYSFANYFGAYVVAGNNVSVNFTFMYHTTKDLKALANHMPRHGMFFAFVYMHELQHIIRKHNTHSYNAMMTRIAGNASNVNSLINIAEDHAIDYSLKDLFTLANMQRIWQDIELIGMYNKEYHSAKLSDIDILKKLIENPPPITCDSLSDTMESEKVNGGSSNIKPKAGAGKDSETEDGTKDKCNTSTDDMDISMSDLSESLQNIISTNTKGTKAGDLFEQLFDSIKVETGWFKKIKASFKRQVFYKTHNYATNWANLNNTYRRIYKAPKKVFIDDKINIILSVDHSGSMSNEDLQKLLYLIESEATRIGKLTVLIHDTRVIKEFNIESDFDISESEDFKSALATRYTSGGTSHECVFERIQGMKIPDPNMVIYMSFSDNYSDIEQTMPNYPIMRKLTNYWICAGANNPVNVHGTNIAMS